MRKRYQVKIYKSDGTFLQNSKAPNFDGFRKQINSGLGVLTFKIPRKFDDFDEGTVIKYNNRVEFWVNDRDTGSDSKLIYSGRILKYSPRLSGKEESVTVTCYGYVTRTAKGIVKIGADVELKTNTTDILKVTTGNATAREVADVVAKAIDLYRTENSNPTINYSATSIEDTAKTITYTFNSAMLYDVLEKCREYAPAGFYWYIGADNILQWRNKPATATHTFTLGKDFESIDVDASAEAVSNKILFSSGDNPDQKILKLYEDTTSAGAFDDAWEVVTDSKVSVEATADNNGTATLASKKDAKIKARVRILDNNGSDKSGYDIESIEPGHTCRFKGFNPLTANTFNENMLIVAVNYTPDYADLELEELDADIARATVKNEKKIAEQQASGRPTKYGVVTDGWHKVGTTGEPAFESSWTNHANTDEENVAFTKDDFGWVRLRGALSGGVIGNTAFTLPAGFRPLKNLRYAVACDNASIYVLANVIILPSGVVRPQVGSNAIFSLNNVMFKAEQ